MSRKALYRKEAQQAHRPRWMGDILLIQPITFKVYTLIAILIGAGILSVLVFADYTRRTTVIGMLIPQSGMIEVTASQAGTIIEKWVNEGDKIEPGQLLYHISTERFGAEGSIENQMMAQVQLRNRLLETEIQNLNSLKEKDMLALVDRMKKLRNELTITEQSIELQQGRVNLAEASAARYRSLFQRNLVSKDQADQRIADFLDQSSRLSVLQREHNSIQRELEVARNEQASLSLKYDNQISQMRREMANNQQELSMSEGRRSFHVVAPAPGIATGNLAQLGQFVDAGRHLVSLIPEGEDLIAHLYAPSRSTGFVTPGTQVRLRMQGFPHQKYGQLPGEVISISRTSIPPNQLALSSLSQSNEPLFLVQVRLSSQYMPMLGEQAGRLQAGMLAEADLLSETRRIYEWALEPLITLKGQF
ncbi:HlyD family efflux transporter periplasmic adaptor subunit [Thiomicrospira microaerophila]|uniref:HlyD family secretion protein n=1 Tax=Thiomicrospira microaerophila TaxID=406020 RepID=UPI00200D0D23|nr:HlyD family efflux transporter periplasmic adaptor subunit [Thiomicrospira microaerophila]UQB42228.1 HlyD family efflux transporter periplasmic adaptor subunit [Thiomicrospira microaerophila]